MDQLPKNLATCVEKIIVCTRVILGHAAHDHHASENYNVRKGKISVMRAGSLHRHGSRVSCRTPRAFASATASPRRAAARSGPEADREEGQGSSGRPRPYVGEHSEVKVNVQQNLFEKVND